MSPVDYKPSMSLWARDAASEIKSAPQTFSSWDKCMAKSYCKYVILDSWRCCIVGIGLMCTDGLLLSESSSGRSLSSQS